MPRKKKPPKRALAPYGLSTSDTCFILSGALPRLLQMQRYLLKQGASPAVLRFDQEGGLYLYTRILTLDSTNQGKIRTQASRLGLHCMETTRWSVPSFTEAEEQRLAELLHIQQPHQASTSKKQEER